MKLPKGFRSEKHFRRYILEIAIDYMESLRQAWIPQFGEPDQDARETIKQATEEIEAMKERLSKIK